MSAQSTAKLLIWLKQYQPEFFATLPASITDPRLNGGLGDWTDIFGTIANAAITYDNNKTARKQIDVNIARAQAGLDPVRFDANSNPITPTTTGVSFNAQANNTFLYIALALGLGGIFLYSQRSKRGRK